ncbi:MAG: hypothetical protein ABSD56_01875 [Bryobacteraceae bacterium]
MESLKPPGAPSQGFPPFELSQIAEAHGGSLLLQNRTTARGCEARLRLPL